MFDILFTPEAQRTYNKLKKLADESLPKKKSTKQAGLFKQVKKTIYLLSRDPRHPGLNTHEYTELIHPWKSDEKVFEAYVQNRTPGAYRVFWCYGPKRKEITIITIIPHP